VLTILGFDGYGEASVCLSQASIVSGYENPQYFDISYGDCITLDYMKGDVNLDEALDILDIVTIMNIIFENISPTDYQIWASDYNSDGDINIMDIVQIVNCILSDCWGTDTTYTQASINMEMSEDLNLTISIDNFVTTSLMSFTIYFDNNSLNIENYSGGDISPTFIISEDSLIAMVFDSLPNNSYTELINIQFAEISNYENTMIYLSDIEIIDPNGNSIYYSCSYTTYTNAYSCIQNGGSWSINSDELFVEDYLCYKLVDGQFIWTNSCFN